MNSWLYLTAQCVAQGPETDVDTACVAVWHDPSAIESTSLNEAAARLKDHEVNLILPMELCSWLLTEPWPNKRRPGTQALAFAVEDQLADDLDELHIAVGQMDAQRRYPLMITHKQRFKELLELLRQRGLNIVSVQVDADLLPIEAACKAQWGGRWIVGGALEARLALSGPALDLVAARLQAPLTERVIDWSAPHKEAINLLQGEFARRSQGLPWRRFSAALLLMFAVALGFTHLRSSVLEHESARVYAQSEARFKTLYPEHTRIVDLSAQLKALQQQGAPARNGHMVRLLQLTEQVLGASSVEVQRMEWRANIGWVLNITASSFAQLEHVRERGVQSGIPVTVGSASQQGGRVQAIVTVRDES